MLAKAVFGTILLQSLFACQEGNLNALEEELTLGALDIVSITVTAPQAAASNDVMPLNETLPFIATGIKSNGDSVDLTTMPTLTWVVSDTNVASIDNNTGVMSSKTTAATVKVSANISSVVGNKNITISDAPLTIITVSPKDGSTIPSSLSNCSSLQLMAVGNYTNFDWDITTKSTWTKTAGDITNEGLYSITNVPVGAAEVTATLGSISTMVSFTIDDDLTGISITPTSLALSVDSTTPLVAMSIRSGAAINNDITALSVWSSDNAQFATVDSGTVTGVAVGNANISAECGGKIPPINNSISVSVSDDKKLERIEIQGLDISGLITIASGATRQLSVKAYYSGSPSTEINADTNTKYVVTNIIGSPINQTVPDGVVTAKVVIIDSAALVTVTYTPDGNEDKKQTDSVTIKVTKP